MMNMYIQWISKKHHCLCHLDQKILDLQCQEAKRSRSLETSLVSKCPHANATHQDRCLKNCSRIDR